MATEHECIVCGADISNVTSHTCAATRQAKSIEGTGHLANIGKPTAIKHDSEKPDMALLSPIALIKIAEVMTFGKKKYSAHNWRGGFAWSRVLSAAFRHLVAFIGGQDKDPETGLSHLAHLGCCIMFLLEFEDTHKDKDDRYKNESR